MTDAGDRGGDLPGGSGAAGDQHKDLLDPRGPMGMPKIVSRAANRLGRGQWGGGNLATEIYVLSVLAIMIALGIFFIVGGPR